MSFIFYDTETTGTDKNFYQILQFAAICTDADLNELEHFEISCRLHAHLAPSPGAMRVTRIGIEVLNDSKLASHYETVGQSEPSFSLGRPPFLPVTTVWPVPRGGIEPPTRGFSILRVR